MATVISGNFGADELEFEGIMVNTNYPKVCRNCRRPHIRRVEDEVKVEGGKTVRHKDCVEMLDWVRGSEDTVRVKREERENAVY